MKPYDELKIEMGVIEKQLVEAKKNERANALKEVKRLCKGLKVGRSNKLRVAGMKLAIKTTKYEAIKLQLLSLLDFRANDISPSRTYYSGIKLLSKMNIPSNNCT